MAFPDAPLWYKREMEHQYRTGFYYGVVKAANYIFTLHRKGFQRSLEIGNIIGNHCEALRRWRREAWRDPNPHAEPPKLIQESWPDIRQRTLDRYGSRCCECGCYQGVEVHHIQPVKFGGLPEDRNLEVLCEKCHDWQHRREP